MIITGFGDKKRTSFNDSDSSQSSDLSNVSKIGSNYSYDSGNNEKLEKEKNTISKFTG